MSSYKRYLAFPGLVLALSFAVPSAVDGQEPPRPPAAQAEVQPMPEVTDEKLTVYVRAFLAERRVQDEFDPLLAAVRNKQDELQHQLREERKAAMQKVYADHGLTEEEYKWITFVVSSNQERREAFEKLLEAAKAGQP